MKNQDELLRRILLNMKYDSRKSLNENKERILLKEETCSEIRQQIQFNLDQETYGVTGQIRSKKYPKWGTWGDGSCICDKYNPAEGYREMCNLTVGFSKKCCKNGKSPSKKKPIVSIGDLEQSNEKENAIQTSQPFYDETAYDGTPMKLPTDVKNLKKTQCGNLRFYYSDEPIRFEAVPKIKSLCTFLRDKNFLSDFNFKTYEDCLSAYGNKMLSFCNDDAVQTFEYENLFYRPCFGGLGSKPTFNPPDKMIFKGYFGKDPLTKDLPEKEGECMGVKWNPSTGTSEKTEKTNTSNELDPQIKTTGVDGGTGSEETTISFIF